MPFIKGLSPSKLSRTLTEVQKSSIRHQSLIERRDAAKRDVQYWTDFLNKGTLTIEQQRKCLYLIEGAEIEYEKVVAEMNANK